MTTQTLDGRDLTAATWRTIPEFPIYEITPDGDVRNRRTGRLVREWQNKTTGAWSYALRKLMPDGSLVNRNRNYTSLVRQTYGE
jgi:hypothetical protein